LPPIQAFAFQKKYCKYLAYIPVRSCTRWIANHEDAGGAEEMKEASPAPAE